MRSTSASLVMSPMFCSSSTSGNWVVRVAAVDARAVAEISTAEILVQPSRANWRRIAVPMEPPAPVMKRTLEVLGSYLNKTYLG